MKSNPLPLTLALLFAGMFDGLAQPTIVTQPQDQTNIVGTTATFTVSATSSSSLSYQWTFGASPTNLDGATDASLVITNVQATNQGPYQVVVTDSQSSITSSVANLYVVAPPALQFAPSSYTVAESDGSTTLVVQRNGWVIPALTVDFATVDGTATNGLKYKSVSGTLNFSAGQTSTNIVVPILNESSVEGTKTFRVQLSNPTGGAVLGNSTNATVSITDNDSGVQFQSSTILVAENAGRVTLWVVRGDDGSLPVSVDFFTSDVTATNGVDYTGVTNTLSFLPQQRLTNVSVPILNNAIKQPNRVFHANLANAVGASLGNQRTTTITIVDDDQGFRFGAASYTVAEDWGAVRLMVLRGTDDTNSSFTVDLSTTDLTATNGVDYVGATNTLLFGPGNIVKHQDVPVLNNGVKASVAKTFRASLSNPTGGAVLGSPVSVNVAIANSDPGVGFEAARITNVWGTTAMSFTILRGDSSALGPITVDYATSDGSARAGTDYQATNGTLQFQQNETVRSLPIPILRNRAMPGSKYFNVTLSNPTGGAVLGPASALGFIVGGYATVAPPYDTLLAIQRDGAVNVVQWSGGGLLQRADNPSGPWQKLTNATSPFVVESLVPQTFYRVTRPRPVDVYIPSSYDGHTPLPLVILLHGYGRTGIVEENYFQFGPLAETRGFLYCYPDGTTDLWGRQFWEGTDACCDFGNAGVDDTSYLRALIKEIGGQFALDQKRIYLIGHSDGGFMAYRMACQSAELIAGIASLAGTTFLDPGACNPVQPVNILHIQGTADQSIFYGGGALTITAGFPANLPQYPGALQNIELWAGYDGASSPVTDPAPTMDLTLDVPGLDTVVTRYTAPPGVAVELWKINGGNHAPTLSPQFSPLVIDWLLARPKP